jgi:cystathionine gamma-synthase
MPRAHHELAPPIQQTATYTFTNSADLARFMAGESENPREEYGRYGNPTAREVELRLAALEKTDDALLFGSGMAAITTSVMALLKSGDHVVIFRDGYRRTRQFVVKVLARFGVTHSLVESGDFEALTRALRPETKLVIGELPSNPHLSCVSIPDLVKVVRAAGRAKVMIDSTFATPVNARPAELGADLVVHSATKYLAGHNDVLAGVICGPSHLVSLARDMRGVLGGICDPHAAFLVGRGLKTLALRVARQNDTALAVAIALEKHPRIERVYYPTLASHPTHEAANAQLRGGGGVVSFVVRGGRSAAAAVVDGCKLAQIAPSLGGVETLIEQPALMSYAELDDAGLAEVGIEPGLIRLAVGIEETADVLDDITASLDELDGLVGEGER